MTPAECRTREDIRAEIDRVDTALIELLAERFAYVRRMAEIKTDPSEARVTARVDAVVARVQSLAVERSLDPDLAADLWTRLIEWNITWEQAAIAANRKGGKPS